MHVLEIKEYLVFESFYLVMKFKMPNTFSLHYTINSNESKFMCGLISI